MMLWLILALMTAGALGAVIWPLLRTRRVASAGSDLAVYRDQLEEIERDRVDGRIGHDEAEAARVEVSRRLLGAAHEAGSPASAAGTGNRRRIVAVVAAVVAVPLLAGPLYALLGSPGLPGQPIAGREAAAGPGNSIGALVARVEAHLEQNPDDGRGWEIIAPVYMKLERYDDAVTARRNAIKFLESTPNREVDLGEALTAAANGVVTDEAKAAFDRAVALDENNFKAQFYLGLAAQQDGKTAEAARMWRELIAKAPPDAPWLGVVRQSLARVEAPQTNAPGPAAEDMAAAAEMTSDQRNQMILTMVERLSTRLHEDGGDVDGWLRLLRAYMVLGEHDKAKAAAVEARGALAREPEKLRVLDEGIKGLGVGG
jgi:cytochrome c-type biogenesis protein CcmH